MYRSPSQLDVLSHRGGPPLAKHIWYVDWLSGMGNWHHFRKKYYCAFTHPILYYKIKLVEQHGFVIAGSIVLVKNLILLKLNFGKIWDCYILTNWCQKMMISFWAQECITIGLYVIRSSWELWSALPGSLMASRTSKTPLPTQQWELILSHRQLVLPHWYASNVYMNQNQHKHHNTAI